MFLSCYRRSFRLAGQVCPFKITSSTNRYKMEESTTLLENIIENTTEILLKSDKVFYNPVQEFNRDLSVAVITEFSKIYVNEECERLQKKSLKQGDGDNPHCPPEVKISILEPLSATGLRSIRYAKELPIVHKIVANDISEEAVETIKANIIHNNVEDRVETSLEDANMVMIQNKSKKKRFTVIDLDPYGCPTNFLDTAVQSVAEGGLLLVTATDMAILAGNTPETCYVKYGSVSLKTKACHEQGLRILLKCISDTANRYSRYIVPLLSVSVDFYVRVFVRIFSGAIHCKKSTSKLSLVYLCTGCQNVLLHPMGGFKPNPKKPDQTKAFIPVVTGKPEHCENCNQKFQMGGPIWTAEMHDRKFLARLLQHVECNPTLFATSKRMMGMLSMIKEELHEVPLYYCMDWILGRVHLSPMKMINMRSAIMNAGYDVSYSHAHKRSIKTNAPSQVIWDIIRTWHKENPASEAKLKADDVARFILSQDIKTNVDLNERDDAEPYSRKEGYKRFQENPAYWGPGSKSSVNDFSLSSKQKRNQNKNKKHGSKRAYSPPTQDGANKKCDAPDSVVDVDQ